MKSKTDKTSEYIYTKYITRPDGTKIYAKQYGLKAFRIPIRPTTNN